MYRKIAQIAVPLAQPISATVTTQLSMRLRAGARWDAARQHQTSIGPDARSTLESPLHP